MLEMVPPVLSVAQKIYIGLLSVSLLAVIALIVLLIQAIVAVGIWIKKNK